MADLTDSTRPLASMRRVQAWIEKHDYKGYEPFDALGSFLRPLACGTLVGEVILQQIGRQSPINIRPLLGVKPLDSSKGRGYIAWGHLTRHAATGDKDHLAKAEECLDWLDRHKSKLHANHSWGNAFDYASRGGWIAKDEPTIVWTSLIGQAFLEAYDQTRNERWLLIADRICAWIVGLPRLETPAGVCLEYTATGDGTCTIHNSSMLGAAMLARTGQLTNNSNYLALAQRAMAYSCQCQLPDGAWYYGEVSEGHWIDSFHTGYNLDSLKRYIAYTKDETWRQNLTRGFEFFKNHFVDPDGCPRYYHNRRQPIDIQGAAQVIDTLAFFSEEDPSSLELSLKVAQWTIANMQDPDGHFYYRRYPLITAKAPMIHWGQATMFKALANLASRLERSTKGTAKGVSPGPV